MSILNESVFEAALPSRDSAVGRDLRLNLKKVVGESSLSPDEAHLALLAVSTSVGDQRLAAYSREALKAFDLTAEQIEEAADSAAIMAMLNTYYRFRHMVGKDEDYRTAGLRMTALAKPLLGKERFEMLAFAVSILNGCETCIKSHEEVLRKASVSADKLHDLARLAATVKGLGTLRRE